MTLLLFLKPSCLYNGPQDAVDAFDARKKKERVREFSPETEQVRRTLKIMADEEAAILSVLDEED